MSIYGLKDILSGKWVHISSKWEMDFYLNNGSLPGENKLPPNRPDAVCGVYGGPGDYVFFDVDDLDLLCSLNLRWSTRVALPGSQVEEIVQSEIKKLSSFLYDKTPAI